MQTGGRRKTEPHEPRRLLVLGQRNAHSVLVRPMITKHGRVGTRPLAVCAAIAFNPDRIALFTACAQCHLFVALHYAILRRIRHGTAADGDGEEHTREKRKLPHSGGTKFGCSVGKEYRKVENSSCKTACSMGACRSQKTYKRTSTCERKSFGISK